eukprot:6212117-Pleurochrysis_carterae.AAC.1
MCIDSHDLRRVLRLRPQTFGVPASLPLCSLSGRQVFHELLELIIAPAATARGAPLACPRTCCELLAGGRCRSHQLIVAHGNILPNSLTAGQLRHVRVALSNED